MHYPKLFRPIMVAALALCLAFSTMMPATAQQQPPQPPTKPPEQKKSDPPKGEQKKAPPRQGAQVEPPAQDLGGEAIKIDTQMVELDVSVIDRDTGTTGVRPALGNVWRADLTPILPRVSVLEPGGVAL